MKYIIALFIVLAHLPVCGQTCDSINRKLEIEQLTEDVYSVNVFKHIADTFQMSITELADYPVIFPVKKPVISSGYGRRYHPIYRVRKFHTGVDFADVKGTPVCSTGNGIVTRKGYNSGYGYFIEIEHTGSFRSFYAHLSKTMVNVGDTVKITQQIGCVGNTGVTTGSHLHYEIRKGKRFLNPIEWCYCLLEMFENDL